MVSELAVANCRNGSKTTPQAWGKRQKRMGLAPKSFSLPTAGRTKLLLFRALLLLARMVLAIHAVYLAAGRLIILPCSCFLVHWGRFDIFLPAAGSL